MRLWCVLVVSFGVNAVGAPCWGGWTSVSVGRYEGTLIQHLSLVSKQIGEIVEFENKSLGISWAMKPEVGAAKLPAPSVLECNFPANALSMRTAAGEWWNGSHFVNAAGLVEIQLERHYGGGMRDRLLLASEPPTNSVRRHDNFTPGKEAKNDSKLEPLVRSELEAPRTPQLTHPSGRPC